MTIVVKFCRCGRYPTPGTCFDIDGEWWNGHGPCDHLRSQCYWFNPADGTEGYGTAPFNDCPDHQSLAAPRS